MSRNNPHAAAGLATALLAAAVVATTLDGGGFSAGSQELLVVLTALALLVTVLVGGDSVVAAMSSPVVVVLVALGALSALSAAWTIAAPQDGLRWGLVVLAYAAIAVSAGVLVAQQGPWPLAAAIAILAAVEAGIGLGAAALHALPDAERLGGRWRPGGTFEYSTALGLVQVAALPALLTALGGGRRVAVPAGFGLALAGAVLGSIDGRFDLTLAAAVLVVAVVYPPGGSERRLESAVAAAIVVVAAIGARLVLAGGSGQGGGGALRLVLLGILTLGLAAVWLPARALARGGPTPSRRAVLGVAVAVLALTAVGIGAARGSGAAANQRGGVTHGRVHEFSAALQTWFDRVPLGAGAGAYYQASLVHQGSATSLFAHDLPLESAAELGIPGLIAGLALYLAAGLELSRARGTTGLWLLGPCVAAFLLSNLVDWPWHLAGLGAVWAAAAGGVSACARRAAANRAQKSKGP